jgi:hypothetical protein
MKEFRSASSSGQPGCSSRNVLFDSTGGLYSKAANFLLWLYPRFEQNACFYNAPSISIPRTGELP